MPGCICVLSSVSNVEDWKTEALGGLIHKIALINILCKIFLGAVKYLQESSPESAKSLVNKLHKGSGVLVVGQSLI